MNILREPDQMSRLRHVVVFVMFVLLFIWCSSALSDAGSEHQIFQARPIELGTSGGNISDISLLYCCSGTLGALVQDGNGVQYILSNNHVLAKSNEGSEGDGVNQPGMIDQNCSANGVVATLSDFVPLKFKKKRSRPSNSVDAAIAEVQSGAVRSDGAILDIGVLSSNTVGPYKNQAVQKSGRTTGHTVGTVAAVDVSIDVGYSQECGGPSNRVARFINQIRINPGSFSDNGDSGSVIVEHGTVDPGDGLPRAVGLLFAGNSTSTLANPINSVLSALGVSMVSGPPPPPPATGTVSGTISRTSDGGPIGGSTVTADTGQSTTSGVFGGYTLLDVPVGDRTITASASGFSSKNLPATVVEDQDTVVNFDLGEAPISAQSIAQCITYNTEGGKNQDKHLLIYVTVVDNDSAPVPNATVKVSINRDGVLFGTASGATDSNGIAGFTAKNAPNGLYETTVTNVVKSGLTFSGITPDNAFDKGNDPVPSTSCLEGSSSVVYEPQGKPRHIYTAGAAKRRHSEELFAIPGVVGHGISRSDNGEHIIEVYLANKEAAKKAKIPGRLENVKVKKVITGPFVAY